MVVTDGGQPRRIDVPVEVPEGVKGDTVFDGSTVNIPKAMPARVMRSAKGRPMRISQGVLSGSATISGGGGAGGAGGGVGGGSGAGSGPVGQFGTLPSSSSPPAGAGVPTSLSNASLADQSVDKKETDELRPKLHHSLFAVVEKLRRKETLSAADGGGFIRNGKAEVQVWLSDKSPGSLAKLKELGFEVVLDAKSSKLIIGRLPVEKLEALARLDFVKYASPQITK
jgi:hypothetical protein